MKILQHTDTIQKPLHFIHQATGYVVTVGVAAFLILAWILASPLLRFGIYLSDLCRTRLNPKLKG